jgi:hypothetical protein
VHYADLVQDPVRTIEAIYARCGMDLHGPARAHIAAFVAANPKGRFGTHGYRLADFGLAADALRERFAAYVERYAIPVEVGAGG